jgi:sugar/nucleoside kinase (ribokinase family)
VDFIEEIRLTVAGTAGGTVVDTAKLGLRNLAVGAVGDDEKADWVLLTLEKYGVDVSGMQRLKGVPTSATILNIRANGERPALHLRGTSDHFDVPSAMYDQVFNAPIVHLGGTGLLKKLDGSASIKLLREAKRRGCTVTFDLIAASADTLAMVEPLLPFIDFFMPSIEEAIVFLSKRHRKTVPNFISTVVQAVVCSQWVERAHSTQIEQASALNLLLTTSE